MEDRKKEENVFIDIVNKQSMEQEQEKEFKNYKKDLENEILEIRKDIFEYEKKRNKLEESEEFKIFNEIKTNSLQPKKNKVVFNKFLVNSTKVIVATSVLVGIFNVSKIKINETINNYKIDKEIESIYNDVNKSNSIYRTDDLKSFYFNTENMSKNILNSSNQDYEFYTAVKFIYESGINDQLKLKNLDSLISELYNYSQLHTLNNSTLNLSDSKTWSEFLRLNNFQDGLITDIKAVSNLEEYIRNLYSESKNEVTK